MQVESLQSPQGTTVDGPLLITPRAFGDDRGWFFESWNQRKFDEAAGEAVTFSQDNHSSSIQGVLRGLHYQLAPEPQAKLVRASVGAIFDVAVDIRRSSPTFGQWVGAELSAENKCQLWIPKDSPMVFTSAVAEVQYKARAFEQGLRAGHHLGRPDLSMPGRWSVLKEATWACRQDAEAPGFRGCVGRGCVPMKVSHRCRRSAWALIAQNRLALS